MIKAHTEACTPDKCHYDNDRCPVVHPAHHLELLREVVARATQGEASPEMKLEPYGEMVTDGWGSGQWIKIFKGQEVTYLRLTVEKRN